MYSGIMGGGGGGGVGGKWSLGKAPDEKLKQWPNLGVDYSISPPCSSETTAYFKHALTLSPSSIPLFNISTVKALGARV